MSSDWTILLSLLHFVVRVDVTLKETELVADGAETRTVKELEGVVRRWLVFVDLSLSCVLTPGAAFRSLCAEEEEEDLRRVFQVSSLCVRVSDLCCCTWAAGSTLTPSHQRWNVMWKWVFQQLILGGLRGCSSRRVHARVRGHRSCLIFYSRLTFHKKSYISNTITKHQQSAYKATKTIKPIKQSESVSYKRPSHLIQEDHCISWAVDLCPFRSLNKL